MTDAEVNVPDTDGNLGRVADQLAEVGRHPQAEAVEPVLDSLARLEHEMSASVIDNVPLSRLAARAEENIALGRQSLERDAREAVARAERALDLLQILEGEIVETTRAQDEARNQREFMSG
jgi:hypothetical protein